MILSQDGKFGWCEACKVRSTIPAPQHSPSRWEAFSVNVAAGLVVASILAVLPVDKQQVSKLISERLSKPLRVAVARQKSRARIVVPDRRPASSEDPDPTPEIPPN
jgi:hypothetical protein